MGREGGSGKRKRKKSGGRGGGRGGRPPNENPAYATGTNLGHRATLGLERRISDSRTCYTAALDSRRRRLYVSSGKLTKAQCEPV